MTTCNKAQANTSRPEEATLRLPDPGHNLPSDGEPLASPLTPANYGAKKTTFPKGPL